MGKVGNRKVGRPRKSQPFKGWSTNAKQEKRLTKARQSCHRSVGNQFSRPRKGTDNQRVLYTKYNRAGSAGFRCLDEDQQAVKVKRSTLANAGFGLFAIRNIRRRDYITQYDGEVITREEAGVRKVNGMHSHIASIDYHTKIDGRLVNRRKSSGLASFANDPRTTGALNSKYGVVGERLLLRATKDIEQGEEIFVTYGNGYWN
jgi:hypothetical protein